jgi:tRNA nucleotidyltransferase (CCA-adding enzyme)
VLRHVSEAFAEDPVRILRVARFAARFAFRVADETLALMCRMVASGEVEHLVAERVWQEIAKGLGEPRPECMLQVLERCGALAQLLPEVRADHAALARAGAAGAPITVRFALLCRGVEEAALSALCERLRVPNAERELAVLACRLGGGLQQAGSASAAELLALLKAADAFRRPARFRELLEAARLGQPGAEVERGCARLEQALAAAAGVDAAAIAGAAAEPAAISARLHEARVRAIAAKLRD